MIRKDKLNVLVLFGGMSVEHDVSIITGVQMLHALDEDKFNVLPIYIDKENRWLMSDRFRNIAIFAQGRERDVSKEVILSHADGCVYLVKKRKLVKICHVDYVFSALHGGEGENGGMSAFLDMCGVRHSAPSHRACLVSYDKHLTKLVCRERGISVVDYAILTSDDKGEEVDSLLSGKLKDLSFPLIVKPCALGSSVGITFARDSQTLKEAIDFAYLFCDEVLIERAVENLREFNLSVLAGGSDVEFSSIEEVHHSRDFLSFEDKYLDNGTITGGGEHSILDIPPEIEQNMKDMARQVVKAMGLSGVVRIDYLYNKDKGALYLNEVNSIPGSMANYLWAREGVSYKELLSKVYEVTSSIKKDKITHFSSSILSQFASGNKFYMKK